MHVRDLLRPPRHLLVMFFGLTTVSAAALGWLDSQLVRQDRALAVQRAQGQRENAAGLAVAALQKQLSEVEERLSAFAALPEKDMAQKAEEYSRKLPHDSVLLSFNSTELDAYPAGHLMYYPTSTATPETPAEEFTRADELEFQQKDYHRVIEALQVFVHSPIPQLRAEALVRLARNCRKGGDWDAAIAAYEQLSPLESVNLRGIPADLMARGAICDVLQAYDAGGRLQHEASALYSDLQNGRWRLTRPIYDVYADQARRVLGPEAAGTPAPEVLAIAEAAQSLWTDWETGKSTQTRQTLWVADRSVLAITRPSADHFVALLTGSDYLEAWLAEVQPLAQSHNSRIVLTDAQDHAVVGHIEEPPNSYSLRLGSATDLPRTIYAISLSNAADVNAFSFRSRLDRRNTETRP